MKSLWLVETLIEGGALQPSVTLARCGKDIILVDTGYQRQEKQLLLELERHGLTPDSVTHVLNTHLHFDHSHNNVLFQRAMIVCSLQEFEWMIGLCDRMVSDSVTLEEVFQFYPELKSFAGTAKPIWTMVKMVRRFWRMERLGRREQFLWLEENQLPAGARAMPTPGHVPHHHSFVFDTPEGAILIAGDAVITHGDEDEDMQTFPPVNRSQYSETKKNLIGFKGMIIPGHGEPFAGNT